MSIESTIDEILTAPSSSAACITVEESLALGDASYVDEDWEGALTAYTATLALLEDHTPQNAQFSVNLVKFRALSHRAACLAKLQRHQEAFEDTVAADSCLSEGIAGLRAGESELCLRRQGLAAWELKLYRETLLAFQKAQQLAQLNNSRQGFPYADWIQRCEQKLMTATAASLKPASVTSADVPVDAPSLSSLPSASPLKITTCDMTAPKYQYYQSDKIMTISILEAGVNEPDLTVQYAPDYLVVQLRKSHGGSMKEFTVIKGPLHAEIVPDQCKVAVRDEKVLIKLRKKEAGEWHELFGKEKKTTSSSSSSSEKKASNDNKTIEGETATATASSVQEADVGSAQRPRPYASPRNWDSIEKQIAEEEEKEKPQGDDAMNKLFQQLYANADPDTRRAMIKSYQTSGGTVLSTNWDEVQKTDYEKERTAPDGVEWKNWEGEKLPMKKDD